MISIHAPVKSATSEVKRGLFGTKISIHAPVKSATVPDVAKQVLEITFQSTRP